MQKHSPHLKDPKTTSMHASGQSTGFGRPYIKWIGLRILSLLSRKLKQKAVGV